MQGCKYKCLLTLLLGVRVSSWCAPQRTESVVGLFVNVFAPRSTVTSLVSMKTLECHKSSWGARASHEQSHRTRRRSRRGRLSNVQPSRDTIGNSKLLTYRANEGVSNGEDGESVANGQTSEELLQTDVSVIYLIIAVKREFRRSRHLL